MSASEGPTLAKVRVWFAAFAALHLAAWTALPLTFTHALPVDLIEGVIWGQGWQLGYDHPPLQAWLLGSADRLFDYQRWAVYLLSQLLVVTTFWAVWRLARLIVSPLGALISVLMLEGILCFNCGSPNLDPDLIEMPLWALATWSFYRALRFGRLLDWTVLGACLAAAAYGKYVGAVLAVVMIGFMMGEPRARRSWGTLGPYACAGFCLLLLTPHLWWGIQRGFPTIEHFQRNARSTNDLHDHLGAWAGFAGGQLAIVVLAGLLVAALGGARQGETRLSLAAAPTTFDRRFIATVALGPLALVFGAAAFTAIEFRVHWSQAMWCFGGLFAVIFLVPTVSRAGLRRFGQAWVAVFLLTAIVYVVGNRFASVARLMGVSNGTELEHVLYRVQREASFPGRELAEEVTHRWRERVGHRLAYVVGSKWVSGNIAFFSPDHPEALRDGIPENSPWIDMSGLRRRGAVVIWDPSRDSHDLSVTLQRRFPTMELQPPLFLDWKTEAKLPPLEIMWGIVYPAPASSGRAATSEPAARAMKDL